MENAGGSYEEKVADFDNNVAKASSADEVITAVYNHMGVPWHQGTLVLSPEVLVQRIYDAEHSRDHNVSAIPETSGLRKKLSEVFALDNRRQQEEERFKLLGIHRAETFEDLFNILTQAEQNGESLKNTKGEPESFDYIKKVIHKLRTDAEAGQEPDFSYMTRMYGLRRKMEELIRLPMITKEFLQFAEQAKDGAGQLDELTIYDKFYSVNKEPDKYRKDHPILTSPDYAQKITGLKSQLIAEGSDKSNGGWLTASLNGGAEAAMEGRLYLNLKPEKLIEVFVELKNKLRSSGLPVMIKIPEYLTVDDLNRPDKCVIYFQPADERMIMAITESVHSAERFENLGKPKFTTRIDRADETTMQGLAFGAEPQRVGGRKAGSFGRIRSKAFAQAYVRAGQLGIDTSPTNSVNFSIFAKKFFVGLGIDPINPAFNYMGKGFSFIRERSN